MGDILSNKLVDLVRRASSNVSLGLESKWGLGKKASGEKHSHQKVVLLGTHFKCLDTNANSVGNRQKMWTQLQCYDFTGITEMQWD